VSTSHWRRRSWPTNSRKITEICGLLQLQSLENTDDRDKRGIQMVLKDLDIAPGWWLVGQEAKAMLTAHPPMPTWVQRSKTLEIYMVSDAGSTNVKRSSYREADERRRPGPTMKESA
jgi:hypothetical protein